MKTENVLERFSEMMISRMEQMKASNWKKGWFTSSYGMNPCNLVGREYNDMNSFFLFLYMMDEDRFKFPIFATFNQIKKLGANVIKGEKSFPVLFWSFSYKSKDGNNITEETYNGMSDIQKKECSVKPFLKSYNVFNLSQTNIEEVAPNAIQKLKKKFNLNDDSYMPTDTFGMYENPEFDDMILFQKWVCPINCIQSDRAFYSPSSDKITIPLKSQFKKGITDDDIYADGQEYYATILHEMAHSTGSEKRLCRNLTGDEKDYAKEELVAELTSALLCNTLGFSNRIIDNNAAYLDAWVAKLKKQPKYIVSVMADVSRAAKMIMEVFAKEEKHLIEESPIMN